MCIQFMLILWHYLIGGQSVRARKFWEFETFYFYCKTQKRKKSFYKTLYAYDTNTPIIYNYVRINLLQ